MTKSQTIGVLNFIKMYLFMFYISHYGSNLCQLNVYAIAS